MTDHEVDTLQPSERAGRRPGLAALWTAAGLLAAFVTLGLLVGLGWTPLLHTDLATDLTAHALVLHDRALLTTAVVVSDAGDDLGVSLITGIAAAGLLIRRRVRAAIYLGAAALLGAAMVPAAKHLFGRLRPVLPNPVAHGGGFSFPSGHATGTAVLCVSLLVVALPLLHRRWRAPLITLATLAVAAVAASRVLLGVHYPSDVLAGALLGTACALALTPLLHARRKHSAP